MKHLAIAAAAAGQITDTAEKEIVYLVDHADISLWRPVLYIVNRAAVAHRLEIVPPDQRADPGAPEYILRDLQPDEFDVIEF